MDEKNQYLRADMQSGSIVPGEYIRLNELSERLGTSKTPLRDAIIRLECEGVVTILPRRGVLMNRLTLQDVADAYGIVGALEASVIVDFCGRFTDDRLDAMAAINNGMTELIEQDDFDRHYADFSGGNIAFHNLFLDLSENRQIKKIILPLKQRLSRFSPSMLYSGMGVPQLPGTWGTGWTDPCRRRPGGCRPAAAPALVLFLLRGIHTAVLPIMTVIGKAGPCVFSNPL